MSGIWKKFNPANDLYDQPLAYRGTIAPFGTYTNPDGSESAGFAWPGMITEPLNALQRLHENSYTEDGRLGIPNPQYQGNKDDALTSLLSIYGGNALNHATRLPENAIGMFAGRHAKTADTKAVKAWHSTPAKFDTFDNAYTDEVGFHFGSKNQAHNRAYAMSDGNPWTYFTKWRDIPVEIEINNPVALSTDPGSFMPMTLAKQLVKDGLAPHELIMEVQKVQLGPAGSPATAKAVVRDYLLSKGYDAVKYPNRFEGVGDPSYMMLNTGNVKHARTGETLYSDTGKPSIAGSAIAAEMMKRDGLSTVRPDWKAASEEDFLRVMDDGFAWDSQRQAYEDRAYADLNRLAYDRSAGEVEARNVQVRADMTPEQRRATPPWLTQDVPFEKQFVQQYGQRSPLPPQPQAPPQGGIRAAWMEPVYPEILPPAPVASTAEDALRWVRESGPIIDGELLSDTGRPSLAGAAVAAENAPTTGITAYHGSPHDFNRFDLSKIGTGEGAQAYGHGLYFAENEGVAKSYRDSLSLDGLGVVARGRLRQHNGDLNQTIEYLRGRVAGNEGNDTPFAVNARQALAELESAKAQGINPGRMYQVRINADPNDFLDWDLPLSQQSEKVRDTVLSMVPENDRYPNSLQGKDAVLSLQASQPGKFLDRSEVSPMLREAGIPGIKYLDQMSRAAGDGSRNYVVFDDSLIEILKKYGLAGGAIGAGSLFDFNTDQQY